MLPSAVRVVKFLQMASTSIYDDKKNYKAVSKLLSGKERSRLS